MREFESGATRDDATDKLDYEGYLSPEVLYQFALYMEEHAHTPNGHRDSDNWQKGIPREELMKSLLRHVMDLWLFHRGVDFVRPETGETPTEFDSFGGAFFNLQALWHSYLQEEDDAEEV
jgi:hypothetical protein